MIERPASRLSRLFDELVEQSSRDGSIRRAQLAGGVELVVQADSAVITLTIKRPRVKVGDRELITFKHHFGVPDTAVVLTPPEQGQRQLDLVWYFVTYRWEREQL